MQPEEFDDILDEDVSVTESPDSGESELNDEIPVLNEDGEQEDHGFQNGFFELEGGDSETQMELWRLKNAMSMLETVHELAEGLSWPPRVVAQHLLGRFELGRMERLFQKHMPRYNRLELLGKPMQTQLVEGATNNSDSAVEWHRKLQEELAHGQLSVPGSPGPGYQEPVYAFQEGPETPWWRKRVHIGRFRVMGQWLEDIRYSIGSEVPVLRKFTLVWTMGPKVIIEQNPMIKEFTNRWYQEPDRLTWVKPEGYNRWVGYMLTKNGCLWAPTTQKGSFWMDCEGEYNPTKPVSMVKGDDRFTFNAGPKAVMVTRYRWLVGDWGVVEQTYQKWVVDKKAVRRLVERDPEDVARDREWGEECPEDYYWETVTPEEGHYETVSLGGKVFMSHPKARALYVRLQKAGYELKYL